MRANLASVSGVQALARELRTLEPSLDVLVNNAGTSSVGCFETFSEHDWDTVMDLNVKAPFFLTQATLDLLQAAAAKNRSAKVINISSVDAIRLNARETYSYGASKAALIKLTEQMAARLIALNIVVSAIAPGAFVSDMNIAARDYGTLLAQRVPAKRIGQPEDMAGAAVFLASRAGDYVVGATLTVDGGFTHALPTHGVPLQ